MYVVFACCAPDFGEQGKESPSAFSVHRSPVRQCTLLCLRYSRKEAGDQLVVHTLHINHGFRSIYHCRAGDDRTSVKSPICGCGVDTKTDLLNMVYGFDYMLGDVM